MTWSITCLERSVSSRAKPRSIQNGARNPDSCHLALMRMLH